jgi:hypothetical protein
MPLDWIKLNIYQIPLAEISCSSLKTFLLLASQMDEDRFCTMSYSRIAAILGISRRQVIRAISDLVWKQMIVKCSSNYETLRIHIQVGAAVGRKSPGEGIQTQRETLDRWETDTHPRKPHIL